MHFKEIAIVRLDNGWLLQYTHVMRQPVRKSAAEIEIEAKRGHVTPTAYTDQLVQGSVAFSSLVDLCEWVAEKSGEKKPMPAEVAVEKAE